MGFDYLWLSNGFGFSSFPWAPVGTGFDGVRFHPERLAASRAGLLEFWRELLAASSFPIEVRGTNFTAGMDLGSDGTPAAEILATGRIRNPPPNSPWGPLNHDIGVEITGYLSRIARLPASSFLFRFYANDPWFWQNPWWDFYRRDPARERLEATTGIELASLAQGVESRTYAVVAPPRPTASGKLVWVRGSASTSGYAVDSHGLRSAVALDRATSTAPAAVLLAALGEFGYDLLTLRAEACQSAIVQTVHRHDGGWWFNGYLADTTVRTSWRYPDGAPLLHQRDCVIEDGRAIYSLERSFHLECRVFVKQAKGRVSVRELAPFPYGTRRYFEVRGLDQAVVTVFPSASAVTYADLEVNGERVDGVRNAALGTITLPVEGTLRVRW